MEVEFPTIQKAWNMIFRAAKEYPDINGLDRVFHNDSRGYRHPMVQKYMDGAINEMELYHFANGLFKKMTKKQRMK